MVLKKLMMTSIVFALFAGIIGCGGSYVADIAGEKISVNDFEQVYSKNNGGYDAAAKTSVEDRQKFLDLYVKFRLKVKEAYSLGYDKDAELRTELNEYRKNLAISYMLEREITQPSLERMYNRKRSEIRASHILIGVVENPSPQDTAAAFAKAMSIIDSLKAGVPFEELALRHSQDPSAQNNKGDLYYFSAGAMVPEFEDAAYSLKAGEYSTVPVRTQFGYHILKVTDIKPNQGTVEAFHIMIRLNPGATFEDSAAAIRRLTEVRDSILAGRDFAEFAKNVSDDTYSSERGGALGSIDRGRTIREFDEVLFSMKDGELSGIVQTPFGVHLVKRGKSQGVPPFKEIEQQLKSEYQNYRFQYDYKNMVNKIRSLYSFTQNDSIVALFAASVDTNKTTNDPDWDSTITSSLRNAAMVTFANSPVTVNTFIERAKAHPDLKNMAMINPGTVPSIVEKVSTDLVVEHHARQLESKFPEFGRTMKEYEEGILLFKAEQENVWNKVQPSDSALRAYFASTIANYTWPDRVNYQELYVTTDSLAKVVQRSLSGYVKDSVVAKKGKGRNAKTTYDTVKVAVAPIPFDSAYTLYNKRPSESRGITGLIPVSTNDVSRRAWSLAAADSNTYFVNDGGFTFTRVLEKDAARNKTFEEAQSEVSGAFQEYETKRLSDEWYQSLTKKYPVQTSAEGLAKTFARPTGSGKENQ